MPHTIAISISRCHLTSYNFTFFGTMIAISGVWPTFFSSGGYKMYYIAEKNEYFEGCIRPKQKEEEEAMQEEEEKETVSE